MSCEGAAGAFSARRYAKFYIGCLEPPFGLLSGDPRQLWELRRSVHCSKGGLDRIATRLLDEFNVEIYLCRVRYFPRWSHWRVFLETRT